MKYSVLTFGCRANQADSCDLERELLAAGGQPAAPGSADLVVVNTCSVTSAADQAARHAVRRLARINPGARILATGCYATRRPDEVGELAGAVRVVPNDLKGGIVRGVLGPQAGAANGAAAGPVRDLRPGDRGRTAYPLRVQTGCDEQCAYCIVPSTRGASRSRPLPRVLDDVRRLAAAGFKELWLTGVHLGAYGKDLQPSCTLRDLLVALDRQAASLDVTFRLSSLEPMDCGDGILDLVAGSQTILPHLHLPLQHASDRMLAMMRRPYSSAHFRALVQRVRDRLPDAAIGTDLIVGFPGETDRDFDEQVDRLAASPVTQVHVFPYSDRPGTEASRLPSKVPGPVIRRRAERLREVGRELTRRFVERQVGHDRPALTLDDGSVALTDNYLKVRIGGGRARNERVRVRLVSSGPLRGEVVA
jgi:threonylcarbamoyladenosine tRNA methylthiotransferase MtaB